jgi:hypothetical protein
LSDNEKEETMKKFFTHLFAAVILFSALSAANAFTIGGAYARLVSCDWGQWGYEYGHIGTYEVNGQYYQVFFGSSYCSY